MTLTALKYQHISLQLLLLDSQSPVLTTWRGLVSHSNVRYSAWLAPEALGAEQTLIVKDMSGKQRSVSYYLFDDDDVSETNPWEHDVSSTPSPSKSTPQLFCA